MGSSLKALAIWVFYLVFAVFAVWMILDPPEAEEIGFPIDEPEYLFGCYYHGQSEIRLELSQATFNGTKVPISYGMRKTLREVFYPQAYPWFDVDDQRFKFRNDRFELIDIKKNRDGELYLQIWNATYLRSADPNDLKAVKFNREACRPN